MGIKSYNPYTPSRRHMTGSDFSEITAAKPEKSLVTSLKKNAGRNNQGKITVRHQGGGSRRKYRIIDFKRRKAGDVQILPVDIRLDLGQQVRRQHVGCFHIAHDAPPKLL